MSGHVNSLAELGGARSLERFLWARAREFNRTAEAIQLYTTQQLTTKALDVLAVCSNPPQGLGDASPSETQRMPPDIRFQVQKLSQQVITEKVSKRASTVHAALGDVCMARGVNSKRTKVIRSLLDKGADPGFPTDAMKSTCLHLASRHNDIGALYAIRDNLTKRKPVNGPHRTAGGMTAGKNQPVAGRYYEGARGRWKALLSRKSLLHDTVLHMPAFGASPEAMSFLLREIAEEGLQRYVEVDGKNNEGNTPLLVLMKSSRGKDRDRVTSVARMLLKAGASPDIADDNGQTPRKMLAGLGLDMAPMPKSERERLGGRH